MSKEKNRLPDEMLRPAAELTPEQRDTALAFHVERLLRFGQQAAGLHEVVYALALVGYLDRAEEQQLAVLGQAALQACGGLVVGPEEVGVDGVGDGHDGLSLQEGTVACPFFQPVAARDEGDGVAGVELLLLAENPVGQVLAAASAVEEGAVVAVGVVLVALAGVVADAGAGPHVVHGPDNGFARGQNLFEVAQRKHALVYPVQVYDVGLLELGQQGDVGASVGYVDGKEVVLLEAVGAPDDGTLPHEFPHQHPVVLQRKDADLVCLLVAHQQSRFNAVVLQSLHQPAGGYGSPSVSFGCIYQ